MSPGAKPAGFDPMSGEFDEFLREIPLFAGLDDRSLAELQLVAQPFRSSAGDTLFRQGDDANGMYLLKEGEVRISRRLPGDEMMELARLERGAVIGEMGILDRGRRSASAIAARESSGYFISFERFELLRSNFARAAFSVIVCFANEVVHRTRHLLSEMDRLIKETPDLAPGKRAPGVAPTRVPDRAVLPPPGTLALLPFFRRFDPGALDLFLRALEIRSLPRGTALFEQNDPPAHCVIVARGALELSLERGERFVQFAILGPGRLAGEVALLDGLPQPFACRAREDSLVLIMDRARFGALRQSGDPTAFKFFETVAGGAVALLRKANGHIAWIRPEKQLAAELSVEHPEGSPERFR